MSVFFSLALSLFSLLAIPPAEAKPLPGSFSAAASLQSHASSWVWLLFPVTSSVQQMVLAKAKKKPKVALRIKLVYGYATSEPKIDPRIQHEIPASDLYDFNAYEYLRESSQISLLDETFRVTMTPRYTFQIVPQRIDSKEKKISLEAKFFYDKTVASSSVLKAPSSPPPSKDGDLVCYSTVQFRLQNGGTVAFIGPSYRQGRLLLLIYAHHVSK